MDISWGKLIIQLRRNCVGLGYLLRLQALSLQHVVEVCVTSKIQLIGSLQFNPSLTEQPGKYPMGDSSANLRLDIITDYRQPFFGKTFLPVLFPGDEDGDAVNQAATGAEDLLHIPLGGFLTANRQIADNYISLRALENVDHICGGARRLGDHLRKIFAQTVMGHPSLHFYPRVRHLTKLEGIVGGNEYGLRQVLTHFILIDIKGSHKLDIADMVSSEFRTPQTRYKLVLLCVTIVVDALN